MEEKFCLKWNDYQENTIKTFSKLQKEEDFYDVTLVSDDQKEVMAHNVALSSSSEYFKNIPEPRQRRVRLMVHQRRVKPRLVTGRVGGRIFGS